MREIRFDIVHINASGYKWLRIPRVTDRISDLPDSLLCHILSFIPTKYSVSTSILSARWKRVWASVPCLEFYDGLFPDFESFVLFVSRVLYFHNSSNIQKFKLECYNAECFFHIYGWIRTAIMHNLVELDLCVEKDGSHSEDERLELPKSLFMCKTLVVLKLQSTFVINTPTSWCLSCLKVPFITVYHPDNDPMEKLLPGCPALKDLAISGTVGEGYLNFNVSALELKKLRINLDTVEDYSLADYNEAFVRAPKLEYFGLKQTALSNSVLENSKSLVKATIDLNYHTATEHSGFAGRATALLKGMGNIVGLIYLVYLILEIYVLKGYNPINFSSSFCLMNNLCFMKENCDLPVFGNLNQLRLVLHCCCSWWAELLKRSPNLESLVLEHDVYNCDGIAEYGFEKMELLWHPPELVPNCLLSHVKTICIKRFLGRDDDFEVAKYLLKNGKVLNSMKIYTGDFFVCTKEDMLEKLLMFERGSKTCQVEIA
ncbi:LOW QUALITY PROTEIN: putative FBD-associated F-box protein At5g53635 [Rosa rugosa]|uniref:LOW QUALITY PROTEIN: putative FBD-associated F-box protein At5g53635 n=1 Tax=Rosa rugosa TaxID=74645 RepID=UPI002B404151|nr:LOW QUALITY PROTEIN: putative FBD-associated F-box protein At5g53635 [Rosa rugosa]